MGQFFHLLSVLPGPADNSVKTTSLTCLSILEETSSVSQLSPAAPTAEGCSWDLKTLVSSGGLLKVQRKKHMTLGNWDISPSCWTEKIQTHLKGTSSDRHHVHPYHIQRVRCEAMRKCAGFQPPSFVIPHTATSENVWLSYP